MKTIIISVTNDLIADYRVHRTALTLQQKLQLNVVLVGRKLRSSPHVQTRSYKVVRFKLPIEKGPLFYALYNITLFVYLLFHKVDILLANDLDTLPANFLISKIKRKKLIFDSHELFTELPELIGRPNVRKIWEKIEKWMMPSAHKSYTVCQSIANYYFNKYHKSFVVIRNVPSVAMTPFSSENEMQLHDNKLIVIYQGAVNLGRGLEKVIAAMPFIENAILQILGDGDILEDLKELIRKKGLQDKVFLLGRVPFAEVAEYTNKAHLGISLEENMGLNYYYALPNKLFAYIQAGIPVLVSDFPEMSGIVTKYNIGRTTLENDPEKLASVLRDMLINKQQRVEWKKNLETAARELCWEKEQEKLLEIFKDL